MIRTPWDAGLSGNAGAFRELAAALLPLVLLGCARDEEASRTTFYSRRVEPLLVSSCAQSPTGSGCHVLADERGNALGNLSVESYEDLALRRDLLVDYGPYGIPGLLLKVVPAFKLSLTSWDNAQPTIITTDIGHVGQQLLDFTSPGFTTLERWIEDGAAENNAPQRPSVRIAPGCAGVVGSDEAFDAALDPATSDFATFREKVNPLLGSRCAAANCHGSPTNALYLTCGETEEQLRWNYFAAGDYVSADANASEILRRVLDPAAGGTYHEGGPIFGSTSAAGYQAILDWATRKAAPTHVPTAPGFAFFAARVQPMLVKRGCMMLGCHSAAMFHDYRLRGGTGGHFGLPATRKNYALSLEQLALESPDPNTSRLIRKNLPRGAGGILHRGGPLFAGDGDPAACDQQAAENGPIDQQSPYCVLVAWIARERAARMNDAEPLTGLVYVRRTPKPGADTPQEWAQFAPGAEVVRVAASLDAAGGISLGVETSLSALCGLNRATSEARRPAVSWDGRRIAFAARGGAEQPYRIYVVENGACAVDAAIAAAAVDERGQPLPTNGEVVHDFDPTFAPDGRIVFVSTRGNVQNAASFSYQGPQRTPADPAKLNTNLYVREGSGTIRQLTFLLNQELLPSFMRDGRVILTAEKRAPGFYQLAGRRINLDGGDYHPLYAQRASIGFEQLTDVVELPDKNFAGILSERGAAHGAGALAVINRSLGVDQLSEDPGDYLVNGSPDVLDYPATGFFQHSLRIVNAASSGRLAGTLGAYAAPSPLPDGRLLASYAANVLNLAQFSGDFDVVVVDPAAADGSNVTPLITGPEDALWPAAIYARQNLGVFRSRLDEANGATRVVGDNGGRAEVTFLDVPLLATLLFQNTRGGRTFPSAGTGLQIWESLPPELGITSLAAGDPFVTQDRYGAVYVRRGLLGDLRPFDDGSAKVTLRGGVPIVLATQTPLSGDTDAALHFQREEMQFYPGEVVRQSFRRELFNGLCGGCHGSLAGRENHVATNPDILTQASDVQARDEPPLNLADVPSAPPRGPDFP